MPAEWSLKEFLEVHRAEVIGMLLTEYNEAESMNLFREEGRAEGRYAALDSLVKKGIITESQAAAEAGVSIEVYRQRLSRDK